jgi:hypothetical protein
MKRRPVGRSEMARSETSDTPARPERPFRLFAVEQRVLAQNVDGKVIDIGAMDSKGGQYCARLDVDAITADPKKSPELALKALIPKLSSDYLDGLFTSGREAEVSGRLQDFPNVEFVLDDERPRGMTDGGPPHRP